MRFGDRLNCDSLARWRRRNLQYHKNLQDQGLSYKDPLIPYFGREVFHDGEICIKHLELDRRQVTLSLRNMYAVDRIVDERTRQGRPIRNLNKKDFVTLVRLENLAQFSVSWKERTGPLEYECAELGKVDGLYTLQIRCRDERGQICVMSAVFLSAWIEDISLRLRKYVSGPKVREILRLKKREWDQVFRKLQG